MSKEQKERLEYLQGEHTVVLTGKELEELAVMVGERERRLTNAANCLAASSASRNYYVRKCEEFTALWRKLYYTGRR